MPVMNAGSTFGLDLSASSLSSTSTSRVCFLGELPQTLSKWWKKSIYLLEEYQALNHSDVPIKHLFQGWLV